MKAKLISVIQWARRAWAGSPSSVASPRIRQAWTSSGLESLERREVLSTSTITPFVPVASGVTTAGSTAEVDLHFAAGQITSTKAQTVLIGFYAEPTPGTTVIPQITEVDGTTGSLLRVVPPKRGGLSSSPSLFYTYLNASTTAAQDIAVKVADPAGQTGNFVLRTFLPGDANGDGSVDASDLAIVKAANGTSLGQANNNPAADFNADGHVGCIDSRLTQLNQGAHADYTATVQAAAATPTPVVPATPVATTTTVTVPVVQTAVATPVVQTAVATPVVQTTVATPVATTLVQATPVAVPVIQQAPAATSVVQTTPVATTTTQATAVTVPTSQAPVWELVYPQGTTTTPVATGTPSGTYSTSSTTTTATPVYYYGQPTVQAPGYTQPTTTTTSAPVYYYGQPVVQAPTTTTIQPSTSTPVYYSTSVAPTTTSTPVYYYGVPATQTTAAPAMTVSYGQASATTQARAS